MTAASPLLTDAAVNAPALTGQSGTALTGEERAEVERRLRVARHRASALTALALGNGIRWAADISGLPLRLVCRVAAAYGITDRPEPARRQSLWEVTVLLPARVARARAVPDYADQEEAA